MRRRQEGYIVITDPEAPTVERDTVICRHCQRIIELKPGTMATVYLIPDDASPTLYREETGGYCGSCAGPLCLSCLAREVTGERCERGSLHWERRLENFEKGARQVLREILG
jgi:hypothetical protein